MDFSYGLGDRVLIGTQEGVVTGQATFTHREDEFMVQLNDDDGLPFERWFAEHTIQKARSH